MIHHGDLFDVLPTLADHAIDACVTDPPYGIGFMGKEWDSFTPGKEAARIVPNKAIGSDNPNLKGRTRGPASSPSAVEYDYTVKGLRGFQGWTERWAMEVFRVLKPGAHLLVCGAPRSFHRMACGIEDAGFEVRDCFSWLFGSGFPKALNVAKAIESRLKSGKARPEDLRRAAMGDAYEPSGRGRVNYDHGSGSAMNGAVTDPALTTDEALAWLGWFTALKPGWEPIFVARKPLVGSVAENVLRDGTGALNIGACRIDPGEFVPGGGNGQAHNGGRFGAHETSGTRPIVEAHDLGRWPANVLLDEDAAALLDAQTGELHSGDAHVLRRGATTGRGMGYGSSASGDVLNATYGDSGGASRFYLVVDWRDSTTYNKPCDQPLGDTSESLTAAGIGNGERPEAERSTSSLSTDGSGNENADRFHPDTKSTIEITTIPTTNSTTSNSSPKRGTTTITNDSEKIMSSSTGLFDAVVSDAESIAPSSSLPSEAREPIRGTVAGARQQPCPNGERSAESTTTPTCGSTAKHGGLAEICLTSQAPGLRFKYCPKPSREERDFGTEGLIARQRDDSRKAGNPGGDNPRNRGLQPRGNFHPTVKPVELMRWLVRLVTPPGGTVLDPFTGSGTTGMACRYELRNFVGIEREADYIAIAERRIAAVAPLFASEETA